MPDQATNRGTTGGDQAVENREPGQDGVDTETRAERGQLLSAL